MEDRTSDRLPAIVEYLRMNPTASLPGAEHATGPGVPQVVHVHEHHHYPPPAPPPPPPKPTVAEQVMPWLYAGLMACIIGTICAFILAVVMVALLVGLAGVAIVAVAIAFAIRAARESKINTMLAARASTTGKRTR